VIAYRIHDGKVRVLLMTSRDTGRWIIPRGNIEPGVTPCRAAEQEAYEEAGVRGTILGSNPLGMYTYSKKLPSGEVRAATVEVCLLRVEERLKKWPERSERRLSWVSIKEAVRTRYRTVQPSLPRPRLRSGVKSLIRWENGQAGEAHPVLINDARGDWFAPVTRFSFVAGCRHVTSN
jgi:8-oxo-dGTP pyrophosphatase MutT (NUDIX family)